MWTPEQKAAFRRLMELREKRDDAKQALKDAESDYREFEAELWERLTEDGTLSTKEATVRVPLGDPWGTVTFSPRETFYGKIANPRRAMEYLEERQMTDEFTEPKFVERQVNGLIRDCIENEVDLPDGFDFYARRYMTITRQKD